MVAAAVAAALLVAGLPAPTLAVRLRDLGQSTLSLTAGAGQGPAAVEPPAAMTAPDEEQDAVPDGAGDGPGSDGGGKGKGTGGRGRKGRGRRPKFKLRMPSPPDPNEKYKAELKRDKIKMAKANLQATLAGAEKGLSDKDRQDPQRGDQDAAQQKTADLAVKRRRR